MKRATLSIVFTAACASPPAEAPRVDPRSTAAVAKRIDDACLARRGAADHYRTAKQLVSRLAGRWAGCGDPGDPLFGFEYTADGHWWKLAYKDGVGWERRESNEDNAGEYKIFPNRAPPAVPLDDDAKQADDFFVMTNIGRPMVVFAFEKEPRRQMSIGYGHAMRCVPIDP